MRDNAARKIVVIFLIFIFLIIFIEISLRIYSNDFSHELIEKNNSDFEFSYLNIYDNFFERIEKENEEWYVPVRPRSVAKPFLASKCTNTVRIFILGGSVAQAYGDRLERGFEKILFGKKAEVINCGVGGYDSFRVSLVMEEIVAYEPDLVIVLSGNNEFYDKVAINPRIYYLDRFLERFLFYRKSKEFVSEQLKERDLFYERDRDKLTDYERSIRSVVEAAKGKDIPIILSTIPVNFSDCPPAGRRPLNKTFFVGQLLLEREEYFSAICVFKEFLRDYPDSEFGYFFLGKAHEKTGDYLKARNKYFKSLELSHWNRATPSSNKVIRQISKESGVTLVDLEDIFINLAPKGLLGRRQFYDFCHLWRQHYSLVTQSIIKEIFRTDLLGLNLYNRYLDFSEILLLDYDFPSLKELGLNERYVYTLAQVAVWEVLEAEVEVSERAIAYFKTLYLMSPESLEQVKNLEKQFQASFVDCLWRRGFMIDNHDIFKKRWPSVLYHVGEIYRRLNLYEESLRYFNKATNLDENNYLSYLSKALVYYDLRQKKKASRYFNEAKKISEGLRKDLKRALIKVGYYKEILEF